MEYFEAFRLVQWVLGLVLGLVLLVRLEEEAEMERVWVPLLELLVLVWAQASGRMEHSESLQLDQRDLGLVQASARLV